MLSTLENLHSSLLADPANGDRRLVYADALADAGRELEAIMQRIIARPGDDALRLEYAAEMERTAGEVR